MANVSLCYTPLAAFRSRREICGDDCIFGKSLVDNNSQRLLAGWQTVGSFQGFSFGIVYNGTEKALILPPSAKNHGFQIQFFSEAEVSGTPGLGMDKESSGTTISCLVLLRGCSLVPSAWIPRRGNEGTTHTGAHALSHTRGHVHTTTRFPPGHVLVTTVVLLSS